MESRITGHIQLAHRGQPAHSLPGVLVRKPNHDGRDDGNDDKADDIGYEFHIYTYPYCFNGPEAYPNTPHISSGAW